MTSWTSSVWFVFWLSWRRWKITAESCDCRKREMNAEMKCKMIFENDFSQIRWIVIQCSIVSVERCNNVIAAETWKNLLLCPQEKIQIAETETWFQWKADIVQTSQRYIVKNRPPDSRISKDQNQIFKILRLMTWQCWFQIQMKTFILQLFPSVWRKSVQHDCGVRQKSCTMRKQILEWYWIQTCVKSTAWLWFQRRSATLFDRNERSAIDDVSCIKCNQRTATWFNP